MLPKRKSGESWEEFQKNLHSLQFRSEKDKSRGDNIAKIDVGVFFANRRRTFGHCRRGQLKREDSVSSLGSNSSNSSKSGDSVQRSKSIRKVKSLEANLNRLHQSKSDEFRRANARVESLEANLNRLHQSKSDEFKRANALR